MMFSQCTYLWILFAVVDSHSPLTEKKTEDGIIKSSCQPNEILINNLQNQINQETLIRISLLKQVYSLVGDMINLKTEMAAMKTNAEEIRRSTDDLRHEDNKMLNEIAQMKQNYTNMSEMIINEQHEHEKIMSEIKQEMKINQNDTSERIVNFQREYEKIFSDLEQMMKFNQNDTSEMIVNIQHELLNVNNSIGLLHIYTDEINDKYGIQVGKWRDCKEILMQSSIRKGKDGVYTIYPDKMDATKVYCDMSTDGGGWTVIQRRIDGKTNFHREWNDYKQGFGDASKEYWLGNDVIHALTSGRNQELRIDMEKFSGSMVYAQYSNFSVESEANKYQLFIHGYTGNAGDMMIKAHNLNGSYFTTMDRDNDKRPSLNCAVTYYTGAWWFNACGYSDLNGVIKTSNKNQPSGLCWGTDYENMKSSKMMIRSMN